MLIDKLNEFSDGQSIVGAAATPIDSTNVIDLGAEFNQPIGTELYLYIVITTTVLAAAGAANVTFNLVTDSAADFSVSPSTIWTSGAIAKATLVAGYTIRVRVPHNTERYVKVTYTPDTNPTTAGAADAFLSPSVQDQTPVEP